MIELWTIGKPKFTFINEGEQEHFEDVELGNTGIAISALRPNGTIKISGNRFEAQAQNGYIQSGAHVTVVEIQHQKLIVQIVQE